MKGVDIVVGGDVGHMSAFMAQAGRLVVCGDAGDALGDSLYEARSTCAGTVASLGADCVEKEMRAEHLAELARAARRRRARRTTRPSSRRYGSARQLYHFDADNARNTDEHTADDRGRDLGLRESATFDRATSPTSSAPPRPASTTSAAGAPSAPLPHFDDLLFLGASLSRYPLEGYRERCDTDACSATATPRSPLHLDIPITIAGMSFGALSASAKEALGPRRDARWARPPPPATAA